MLLLESMLYFHRDTVLRGLFKMLDVTSSDNV